MEQILSTVIICVVLALICALGIRSYIKKLKNGCCGTGGDEVKRVRPSDKDEEHYAYVRRIVIEGMHCRNCALRIENAFNQREGFYATVDWKRGYALVRTKHPVEDDELRQVVLRCGYEAVRFTAADAPS